MSLANEPKNLRMDDTTADISSCAACGREGDGLKKCGACQMVKYCNATCQKAHRPKHMKACKKRAAELFDEKLFAAPPPKEDCPICCLPMRISTSETTYQACCGQLLCNGCIAAHSMAQDERLSAKRPDTWDDCPFCRTVAPKTNREATERTHKRMAVNDPGAFLRMASYHNKGIRGFPLDKEKALEVYLRAAELGSMAANHNVGQAFHFGDGTGKDRKKATHHYQLAAMAGHEVSRYNLGHFEADNGNMRRAMKHWMISAKAGHDMSLDKVRMGYSNGCGIVSKDEFAAALRAHKDAGDELKSEQRDFAARFALFAKMRKG